MSKEWILNSATNRFQFNYARNVGAVSEAIRVCQPNDLDEWREYYYANIRPEHHLEKLGKRLYIKVTEVLQAEIDDISEEDCVSYLKNLVINRTYDGYIREKKTVYEQLERELGRKIEPAPDKWDRGYNVDFFITVQESFIGLQIKPVNLNQTIAEVFKERSLQLESHLQFQEKFGGKVFYVFSTKDGKEKKISNPEVVDEIRAEILRLESKGSN